MNMNTNMHVLVVMVALVVVPTHALKQQLAIVHEWELELASLPPQHQAGAAGQRIKDVISYYNNFAYEASAQGEGDGNETEYERIKKKFFAGKETQSHPMLVMMGGGTSSGKSTVIPKLPAGILPANGTYVNIDPDAIMAEIDGYIKAKAAKNRCAASIYHGESSTYAKQLFTDALAQKYHILYDSTMHSVNSTMKRANAAVNVGYSLNMVGVTVDAATAAVRAASRANATMRWVPLDVIAESHEGFSDSFMSYPEHFTHSMLYDNDLSDPLVVLDDTDDTADKIVWSLFDSFNKKSEITYQSLREQLPADVRSVYDDLDRECGSGPAPVPTPSPANAESGGLYVHWWGVVLFLAAGVAVAGLVMVLRPVLCKSKDRRGLLLADEGNINEYQ